MTIDTLVLLECITAGAMIAVLAARFLLPFKTRDSILRFYQHIVMPHRN